MTRDDLKRFLALDIAFDSIGLLPPMEDDPDYFCTPVGAEHVGRIGSDGVHFVLLPGDERVFCIDPAMGEPGTYVLPVGEDFRTFLSYILFCKDANPISQIWWMDEGRYRALLEEDAQATWPGSEEFFAQKARTLAAIAESFDLAPADPYFPVRAMQAAFDPSVLRFSDEYYEFLGIERD